MSTANNNIIRGGAQGRSIFPSALPVLSSAVSYNQGDLLTFDTTNKILAVAATGNGSKLLGVAVNTVVNGVPKSPYTTAVDASVGVTDMAGPLYSVVATFTLDTGSTLTIGSKVYISVNGAQNVSAVQPGSDVAVGIYTGSQGAFAGSAAGQKVDILVGAAYGMAGLTF